MNIKSMLLGTAAALVAVTGARAADAVVMVEPEPMEYVRVCDVYGTGFFYIPGTETCLKISGYVRMRVQVSDNSDVPDLDADNDDEVGMQTRVRGRLDFDAREETELGTLRGKLRLQATNRSGGDAGFAMDHGFIQLGGLTLGYLDSLWANDDGGIGDGLFTDNDWSAGDFKNNRISYTYTANGFSGSLSLEDDGTGDFVPDVLAKLAYTGGFGGAYIVGVFDEEEYAPGYDNGNFGGFGSFDFFNTLPEGYSADDSAFALKAGIMLENLIAEDSAFKIEGHYAFDPTVYAVVDYVVSDQYTSFGQNGPQIPSEYQIGAAYQQQFGKLFAAVSGVYGKTFDFEQSIGNGFFNGFEFVGPTDTIDGAEYYGVAVNVGYDITSNFSVLGEVSYRDIDLPAGVDDYDQTGGFIQFLRTF